MTKEEFLKLTGIRQMSDPDYEKVEHAYMSVPDMDKQTFCELYANNQPELLSTMANVLEREKTEKESCKQCLENVAGNCLRGLKEKKAEPFYEALADIQIEIGIRAMILKKIESEDSFSSDERHYIYENLA